jgi:hypothetical protein
MSPKMSARSHKSRSHYLTRVASIFQPITIKRRLKHIPNLLKSRHCTQMVAQTHTNKTNMGRPLKNSVIKRRSVIGRPTVVFGVIVFTMSSSMISIVVRMEAKLRREKRQSIMVSKQQQLNRFSSFRGVLVDSRGKVDSYALGSTLKVTGTLSKKQQKKLEEQKKYDNSITNTTDDKDVLEIFKSFNDPPVIRPPIIYPNIQDFDPNMPGSVVVTKIQGPPHLRALRQMLCLFTKAYNDRARRDIIVFSSEAIDREDVQSLEYIASPAKLTVEIDNPGLHDMVNSFSPIQQSKLLERCRVTNVSELTWYSQCDEEGSYATLKGERIAYTWQAEFRALHLWTHKALHPYKYMMWMDSDAFCTRVWNEDPLAAIVRHDLVLVSDVDIMLSFGYECIYLCAEPQFFSSRFL